MPCNLPLPAYRDRNGGPVSIGRWSGTDRMDSLELPCGRCMGCRQDKRLAWTIRCTHEAQLYDANTFITLSYDEDNLPGDMSLEYGHVQLWLKRLRKRLKGVTKLPDGRRPIRFFLSGEYGPTTGRPHWHAILFNAWFEDSVQLMNKSYRSETADKLWSLGNTSLDLVNATTIAYVAGYTQDKLYGSDAYEDLVNVRTGEISKRRPPLVSMSRRPGIGAGWYERFASDLFGTSESPRDIAVIQGRRRKVPSYYWRYFQQNGDPFVIDEIRQKRLDRAAEVDVSENTIERRAAKEEAAIRRIRTFSGRKTF